MNRKITTPTSGPSMAAWSRRFALLMPLFMLTAIGAGANEVAQLPAPPKEANADSPPAAENKVDPKWIDRIPKDDRAAIDANIGFAPAPFPSEGLKWMPDQAVSWNDLRGKVVVIQSWTTGTPVGRKWPTRLATALKDFDSEDVRIIALHTPEDAAGAEAFMKKQKPPEHVQVIIDAQGEFCDALGIYKEPVNIVIDRNGTVRYAGLNANGLESAVKALVPEVYDAKKIPQAKPEEKKLPSAGEFPPFAGTITGAKDIRGKRAPEFHAQDWITNKPNPAGKVVVIDFWATWCGPCVQAIPHMNELATQFGDQVCCIGLSDESKGDFNKGMTKLEKTKNITIETFQYPLALDSTKAMFNAISIRGIPHCIVMSKDWTVRWQGHPKDLSAQILEKIVAADSGAVKGQGSKRRGWVKS